MGCGRPVAQNRPAGMQNEPTPVPKPLSTESLGTPMAAPASSGGGAGKNAGRVAAIIVLAGFLMPWISCQGLMGRETASGIQLASRGASGLWIIPISMLIALGVLMNKGKSIRERATVAKAMIGADIASLVVILYYYARLNGAGQRDEFGLGAAMRQAFSIEIGAILSLLGSIGVAISGFIHLQSTLQSQTPAGSTEDSPGSSSASG